MATFGYKEIQKFGQGIQCLANKDNAMWKAGGVTVFWDSITAEAADREIRPAGETVNTNFLNSASPADDYVYAGEKYIRWGTILCRINGGSAAGKFAPYGSTTIGGGALLKTRGNMYVVNQSVHDNDYNSDHVPGGVFEGGLVYRNTVKVNYASVQTITISATGGTFTVSYKGQTTAGQAFNVSASNLQTALQGLSTIGSGNATVSLSGSTYTITLADALGVHELFTTNAGSLTGGSQTATVAASADTLAGPTQAEFDAAFPQIRYVAD
jgi:hypothetical protein